MNRRSGVLFALLACAPLLAAAQGETVNPVDLPACRRPSICPPIGISSLDPTVTHQGNTFNGAGQLVQLDGNGILNINNIQSPLSMSLTAQPNNATGQIGYGITITGGGMSDATPSGNSLDGGPVVIQSSGSAAGGDGYSGPVIIKTGDASFSPTAVFNESNVGTVIIKAGAGNGSNFGSTRFGAPNHAGVYIYGGYGGVSPTHPTSGGRGGDVVIQAGTTSATACGTGCFGGNLYLQGGTGGPNQGTGFGSNVYIQPGPKGELFVQAVLGTDFGGHNISNVGTITAAHFVGDGSGLTGITASATPAGNNTDVQYNNAGATGGSDNFTFDGTNVSIAGLITANGGATVTGGNVSLTDGAGSLLSMPSDGSVTLSNTAGGSLLFDASGNATINTPSLLLTVNAGLTQNTPGGNNLFSDDTHGFNAIFGGGDFHLTAAGDIAQMLTAGGILVRADDSSGIVLRTGHGLSINNGGGDTAGFSGTVASPTSITVIDGIVTDVH